MIDEQQNISGTHMPCTDVDCGCELAIISPCPHGGGYTCACGHDMQPMSSAAAGGNQ